jgi:Ca-activated chloride channel homolog
MTWFRSLGWVELVLAGLFVVAYAVYLFRIIHIARLLRTSFDTVFIKLGLRTIIFGLFMIAWLGPSIGQSKKEIRSVGKDIMICIDLSRSMDASDVQPSRLEKVKYEMKRLAEAFSSDRIGLIIFSSEAFMQCPLTYDQNALQLFVETMSSGLVPTTGTDFGPPLKLALTKLKDQEGPSTQQKSKVIILISDGEDFGDDASEIIQEIDDQGIKLFTLGVGTQQGGQIMTSKGVKVDAKGDPVTTKLKPSSLKDLASKTNGEYFEINERKNEVTKLINTIGQLEGEVRDARMVDASANRYFYFLLAALILLIVDVLISIRTVRI